MPLSTTNLALHVDIPGVDTVFENANGGGSGIHTNTPSGAPADGDLIEIWDDEGDGLYTGTPGVCLRYWNTTTNRPVLRSTTSLLMSMANLSFDGSNHNMRAALQDISTTRIASDFVGASAKTIIVAFYAEAITLTSANPYENHTLVADATGFFGLHLRSSGGTKVTAYSFNGVGNDTHEISCSAGASHVVVMRHDASNLYLSLDGGSETSTAAGATSNLGGDFAIGKSSGASSYFNGRIGEIAIYNAAITGSALSDSIAHFTSRWLAPAFTPFPEIYDQTVHKLFRRRYIPVPY